VAESKDRVAVQLVKELVGTLELALDIVHGDHCEDTDLRDCESCVGPGPRAVLAKASRFLEEKLLTEDPAAIHKTYCKDGDLNCRGGCW
jgi:hypothetical protein